MRKPRKLDDCDWMNRCIAWIELRKQWSRYLEDVAIPRAYDEARTLWFEADARGDEDFLLSAGFKVFALLLLSRRIASYRRLISGSVRFPLTGSDVFALPASVEHRENADRKEAAGIEGSFRLLMAAYNAKFETSRVCDHAVAYCRDFLSWEMSAPRLGANRHCARCGRCCTDLWDAYDFTAGERDMLLWSLRGRWDIIEKIDWSIWHCWLVPKGGGTPGACPWLNKNGVGKIFSCGIEAVKPKHCRVWRGCPAGQPGHSVEKALCRAGTRTAGESPVISEGLRG